MDSTMDVNNLSHIFMKLCKDKSLKADAELLKRLQKHDPLILDLSNLTISKEMCHVLGLLLSFNDTIVEARFSDSRICSEGMKEILSCLISNTSIQKLNLKGNEMRGDTVEALGMLLRNNNTLTSLCLEWNNLGMLESSFAIFCDGIRANVGLEHLDLRNNQITHCGTKELAEGLYSNKTLKSIDLKWNKIGLAGGRALLNLLHKNKSLVTLDLTGNDVPCDIVRSIESVLLRNQEFQFLSDNCKKKTHLLCKKYRSLDSERKNQVLDLLDQLSHAEADLKKEKRNTGFQCTQLQTLLEEKAQAFNELYSKFAQLELELSLTQEKLQDQENLTKHLQSKHSDAVLQHQKDIRTEKEKSFEKEQKLLKDLSDANSKISQMQCKISDLEAKNQFCLEDVYQMKEEIAHLHSEMKLKEGHHHDVLLAEKMRYNEQLKQMEESNHKEEMLRKSGWENIKTDLQNQLQKMTDQCQELEKEIMNMKSERISAIKEADENLNQARIKILAEKSQYQRQLEEKVLDLENQKQDLKIEIDDVRKHLNKANKELSQINIEKETEIGRIQCELQKKEKQLELEEGKITEWKNQVFMLEQKINEQNGLHRIALEQKEKEVIELQEKLHTQGNQLNCLCEEVSQRAQSLQAAVNRTHLGRC